jgi:hypothetical protein
LQEIYNSNTQDIQTQGIDGSQFQFQIPGSNSDIQTGCEKIVIVENTCNKTIGDPDFRNTLRIKILFGNVSRMNSKIIWLTVTL